MQLSQDFSFFKKLYQSELLSIQIEGGAYDPIQNMFVNVVLFCTDPDDSEIRGIF